MNDQESKLTKQNENEDEIVRVPAFLLEAQACRFSRTVALIVGAWVVSVFALAAALIMAID